MRSCRPSPRQVDATAAQPSARTSTSSGAPKTLTRADPDGANHSCHSNLWMLDDRTVGARRDIASCEESTLDYALITVSPEWRMQ
jgi:hypothetical protein